MEKAVNRTKRVEGFTEKRRLFHSEPTSFFREYDNANLLNMQDGGNATNAVKHRMQCIRFQAEKYFMCKRHIG